MQPILYPLDYTEQYERFTNQKKAGRGVAYYANIVCTCYVRILALRRRKSVYSKTTKATTCSMLDVYVRTIIDPPLNYIGKRISSCGMSANVTTLIGFFVGVLAMVMIGTRQYLLAALLIAINRLLDGIDGAIARHKGLTDFGGFLDIVCDFIVYAGIIFAFGVANPKNLYAAIFLIFSFIGPMAAFLAYAIIAAKKQIHTNCRGKKSFYYSGGICEGTETVLTLILMCLYPGRFNVICLVFGILCWMTTMGRIYRAWHDFG